MTLFEYTAISASAVLLLLLVVYLTRRSRRKALEKARAESFYRANLTFEVWVCRFCGCKSFMKAEECHWCGAPRPEEYVSMLIKEKEYAAQLHPPPPKAHA